METDDDLGDMDFEAHQKAIRSSIPNASVLLSDAFSSLFNRVNPTLDELENDIDNAERIGDTQKYFPLLKKLEECQTKASLVLLNALDQGELVASFINEGNKIENVAASDWSTVSNSQIEKANLFLGEIFDAATIPALRNNRILFVDEGKFKAWLERKVSGKRARGRPKGGGAYDDRSLLEKMRISVLNGTAKSPHYAALICAEQAEGNSTHQSKVSRLLRKYIATYGS